MEHSNLNPNNSTTPSSSGSPSPLNDFSGATGESTPLKINQNGFYTELPQNMEGGPKPIHLIYYNQEDKTFRVSEEAKTFLSSIKDRVGVISVAGKYRTGKSFLLNRVIINQANRGFGVGPTINPCTKGLWMWGETLEGEYQGEKLKVLLIDSEGIGAFDEDENHDTKIFLFALLLCSYFIYNSMGTIDENAINNLSLIINLSKELQIKSDVFPGESDPDEIAKYFPSFLWVVRDFSLRLLDQYGNPLTQKEYLESAIQPQRGTSDQIETKNRIRRLIKHFFKDRDCYTLVRPVEEEKQLQSLQSMPDECLRQEFVQSVNQLRTKIFKRVRPKTLNSKFITGEMLLELCYSYTEAVNTGSVPNIQNAWSYVCQNECQRAINDAIQCYEQHIRKVALEQAKQLNDEEVIKKEHRVHRDIAVQSFKAKAVGQDIQNFESTLRDGLAKKYREVKQEFSRYCRVKAQQFLEPDLNQLRRNLQNDFFPTMDQFMEALDLIKQKYNTSGPNFATKSEVFSDLALSLVTKAADFLTISSKKEVDVNLKLLKEKVEDLEREKSALKLERDQDKQALAVKLQSLESDLHTSIRQEKVLEERLKWANEEREKSEKAVNDRWLKQQGEATDQVKALEGKVKGLESQLKGKENEMFKHKSEFEKLNALIEQKLQLTENELSELKNKYSQKDQDYKELNKELYAARKELQQLTQQIHHKSQDHQDELRKLQSEHDKALEELTSKINSSGNSTASNSSNHQEEQWNRERNQMQIQMKMLTETMEQQKKMQESLLAAISGAKHHSPHEKKSENKYKEKNKELLVTNQNLSQQIVQMQQKQQNLEKMISTLKQFKYMIHYAIAVQCKTCQKLYPKNQYSQHLPQCNRDNEQRMSTLNAQQNIYSFEIAIPSCQKDQVNKSWNYEIVIEKNGQQWRLQKSLQDIRQLFEELYAQFPTYSLPYIPEEWLQNGQDDFYQVELKKKLQIFLIDIVRVPFIRENYILRAFFDMDQNYVDDDFDPRRTLQSMGGGNNHTNTTFNSLSTTFTSNGGNRNSVLNPFSQPSIMMVNPNAKTMDGRKSVVPVMQGSQNMVFQQANQDFQQQQQQPVFGRMGNSNPSNQNLFSQAAMREQIQELVEDEDYSSMASNNRISQMMQQDDLISNRQSVFSIKNLDIKLDPHQQQIIYQSASKGNSPFQQVDVNQHSHEHSSNSKSKDRYSQVKVQLMQIDSENPSLVNSACGVGSIPMINDELQHEFEDSFNNDMSVGEMSITSKKINVGGDDELFSHRVNAASGRQDENSPPQTTVGDISKTKANLIKKFESEASSLNTSQVAFGSNNTLQRKITNSRYDDSSMMEDEEELVQSLVHVDHQLTEEGCGGDDDLQRE